MNTVKFSYLLPLLIFFLADCSDTDNSKDVSQHPRIYSSMQEKEGFNQSLTNTKWKAELVEKKKANLEKYLKYHEEDSLWLVSKLQMNWKTKHSKVYLLGGDFSHSDGEAPVPTVRYSGTRDWATDYITPSIEDVQPYFDDERGLYLQRKDNKNYEWVKPSEVGHAIESINNKIMKLVEDAAFLYWHTGDVKYAEFAAPVFFQYIDGMYYRDAPVVLDESSQRNVSGLATFEVIHEKIVISLAITYDFLFDYYNHIGKDLDKSEAVFQKWGDQIIKYGIPDNNWNLFQARFLTYIALVLEDDSHYENGKGQQYYLKKTFDESSSRQIALKESMLIYDQENGIWPESPSYSLHVTTTFLEILTLLDHITDANELTNFPIIEKAAIAAFQYLFPNGYNVGFGDSGHKTLPPENFEFLIANYRKYDNKEKEVMVSQLLQQLIDADLYKRKAHNLFELFFYVDELAVGQPKTDLKTLISPTFYAPNVSWFAQRLGEGEKAMMVSTVGSYGNHAHANGIAIELYANEYVLGPDFGRGSSYWHPDFREFYSQYPAHNTVVVDGISGHKPMRGYHPFTLENCFPKPETIPGFDNVTFSDVSFLEPKTLANQRRLTAQIKTKSGDGYVLDVFRSKKKNNQSQKHEYIYHNLGQTLDLFGVKGSPLKMKNTTELSSQNGDMKGYDYFTNKKKTTTNNDLIAQFQLHTKEAADHQMKLWIKGQDKQNVFTLKSPENNAISEGTAPKEILEKEVPTLILQRNEEAWVNPFVVVFNPSLVGEYNPITSVDFDELELGVQRINVFHEDQETTDILTVGESVNDIAVGDEFYQKGLFSITRITKLDSVPDFIFASGIYQLQTHGWGVRAIGKATTVCIEKNEQGFMLHNEAPFVLGTPKNRMQGISKIKIIENGVLITEKTGVASRYNSEQVEFRIERTFDNALILFEK